MSHLTDRIAEFVFNELSPSEMEQSRRHLSECADCRQQVDEFERTHRYLKASPDVEPPRRIIFEAERRVFAPFLWRWAAPMAASAAVAFAVLMAAPKPQSIERVVVREQPVVQSVDYQKIIDDLRASQLEWLQAEFRKRGIEESKNLERLRGELAYLESLQRAAYKETVENASSIQLLAQRSERQE